MEKQTLNLHGAAKTVFGAGGVARLSVFISGAAVVGCSWRKASSRLINTRISSTGPSRVMAIGWQASIDGGPALALSVDSDPLNPLKPAPVGCAVQQTPRR